MTKHTDTQRLVILFGELFNIKFNKKQFPMQLGIAKTLLLNYSYDDLVEVLKYLKDKSTNIYSLAYIPYVIDETLLKIKVEKEKQKELEKIKNIKVINSDLSDNKKKATKKSLLNKNNIFGGFYNE